MEKEKGKSWKRWLSWMAFALILIIVYKTLDNLASVTGFVKNLLDTMMPFIVGLLIAYLLYIPCRKVESMYKKVKKPKLVAKKARTLSVITVYILAIVILILLFNFIIPAVTQSLNDLVNNFQGYYNMTMGKLNELPEESVLRSDIVKQVTEGISHIDLKQYLNMDRLAEYAKGAVSVVGSIFDAFVAVIASIYLLLERGQIVEFIRKLAKKVLKEKDYNRIGKYFRNGNEIFFRFLTSQLLDGFVVGVLTSVAMSLLGVKYAVLLGFMIGLFNLIPYFGAIIAVSVAILITLITGGLGQAIWMAIIVIILQQIDANIINPKIVGSSLSISPLLVIFAVTIGGAYFGVLGMFLAVPVVTVIKLILTEYIEYEDKKVVEEIKE